MPAWLYADKGGIGIANNSSDRMMKQVDPGNGLCRVHPKFNRGRKLSRAGKGQHYSVGFLVLLFFGFVGFLLLGGQDSSERKEFFDNQNTEGQDSIWAETKQIVRREGDKEILQQKDGRELGGVLVHGSRSWASKVLGFGQGSTGSGQDSRYWDRDDRRRDEKYEKDFEILNTDVRSVSKSRKIGLGDDEEDAKENSFKSHGKSGVDKDNVYQRTGATHSEHLDKGNKSIRMPNGQNFQNESLYNEQGRDELQIYEAQYEADLEERGLNKTGYEAGLVNADNGNNTGEDITGNLSSIEGRNRQTSQIQNSKRSAVEDVYDDRIDGDDLFSENKTFDINDQPGMEKDHHQNYEGKNIIETQINMSLKHSYNSEIDNNNFSVAENNVSLKKSDNGNLEQRLESNFDKEASVFISSFDQENTVKAIHEWSQNLSRREKLANLSEIGTWKVDTQKRSTNSSKSKRRKPPILPCEVGFLNSTEGLQEPEENPKFAKFSLEYVQREEKPDGVDVWEPRFAGHQSLDERENSFYARDQKLHCGFVKGPEGSLSTWFDLYEEDAEFLRTCRIAVSSCIFGNSDNIRAPTRKKVSQTSKKNVCFVMFIDEKTLETLSSEGQKPDESGHIGLWKIVLVRNVPYTDMRRTGKVPKFLAHRLFPSARYSIWIDSKMRLNSDPIHILEYFLWRGGFEYAISNHYDRHCVWEEVMQNKRLNKFNHTLIDEQFSLYQADGLTKFNASDPNTLLPSYVPEGSFIVRAHSPMSNLFSCLWFNEVDRFTPRDQLSFAYTFLKLRRMSPETHLWLNMFKDCERRFLSKLFHHRTE